MKKFIFRPSHKSFSDAVKAKICDGCRRSFFKESVVCQCCNSDKLPADFIKSKNFFQLFDLEENLLIERSLLDKNYKLLQKLMHPDMYATESNETMKEAQEMSSQVIKAYEVLKDDYERAIYLVDG